MCKSYNDFSQFVKKKKNSISNTINNNDIFYSFCFLNRIV